MNEDRVVGSARNLGGKAEEGIGRATGDVRTEAEGIGNQAKRRGAEPLRAGPRGAADIAEAARDAGSSFERLLRNTIEQQPYTAAAIALGLGWLLGRTHRPL